MQQDLSSGMAVLAVWPFMNQQDLSSAMAVRPFTNQTGKFFMVVAAQLVWLLGGGGGEGMGGGWLEAFAAWKGEGGGGRGLRNPLRSSAVYSKEAHRYGLPRHFFRFRIAKPMGHNKEDSLKIGNAVEIATVMGFLLCFARE